MKSKIIGFGSFGYIFSPCLIFNENLNINKDEYITKLLYHEDAEDELNFIKLINKIDISCNYHLGKYYKTKLIKDIHKNIIDDYNLFHFKKFKMNINDLTPIIMKNGGRNLNHYAKKFKLYTKNNIDIIYSFLIEYYKLLEGIKLFNDNNIVLHDIKPANILYDINKNKLVFIDFSLTNTKNNIINLSKDSNYDLSIHHSSFPFELNYYNYDKYSNLKMGSNLDIDVLCLRLDLGLNKNIKITNMDKKLLDSFNSLSNYYYNAKEHNKNDIINNMLIKFKFLLLDLKKIKYDEFIFKSLNTLDSYSYGITLIFILNHIEHIIPNELSIVLMDLAIKLSFIDLNNRLSIEEGLEKFKDILIKYIGYEV